MINRAEMERSSDIKARLPISTDQEVQDIFRRKIEFIRRGVDLPVRVGSPYNQPLDSQQHLFSFTAEEYSYLEGMHWRDGKIGRVESNRLQALGLEVMKGYGFDENSSMPEYQNRGWIQDGTIDDRDGTSREFRIYPSKTINGLAFERVKKYGTATGEVISVSWSVLDKAPLFRINIGKKSKK